MLRLVVKRWGFPASLKMLLSPEAYVAKLVAQHPKAKWIQIGKRTLIPLKPVLARELIPVTKDNTKRSKFLDSLAQRFPNVVFFLPQPNAHWRKLRKPMNEVLVDKQARAAYIRAFAPIVDRWVDSHIDIVISYSDLKALMGELIILLISGNIPVEHDFHEKLFNDFESLVGVVGLSALLPNWLAEFVWSWQNGEDRRNSIVDRLYKVIEQARSGRFNPGPFLNALLDAEDLTMDELAGELLALYLASSDTTPTTLGWVINELAGDNKKAAYIASTVKRGAITFDSLSGLTALDELIDHTMIHQTILSVLNRHAETDLHLSSGEVIDAGSDLLIPMQVVHSGADMNYGLGSGMTKCPGGEIAFDIMKLVVATILGKGRILKQFNVGEPKYDRGLVKPLSHLWLIR